MKYLIYLFFLLLPVTGCKEKRLSHAELENKLMKTMKDFLVNNSTPGMAITVKDVTYYADKKQYICEFHVNMHNDTKDTTGIMTATISDDFSTVKRSR